MKDKTERAARKTGSRAAPKPRFPKQHPFLASNADSSYITGTVLQVMGGETTGG
jgi:NAD(P)-dependent dehydrogenase (short-subunit alcohol dehydrogenase family)